MKKYQIPIKTFQNKQQFMIVSFSDKGVCEMGRPTGSKNSLDELINQEGENGRLIIEFLNAFFYGYFKRSDDLKNKIKLAPQGTGFQKDVWSGIKSITAGEILSYKELAEKIGRPKALQAVGTACGKNPLPMLIPCHRVIASSGKVGGWSGKMSKNLLLKKEGVTL